MTWLFNILIGIGAFALTIGFIFFCLHFVFVGWKKDLLRWGKALGIIGVILIVVPSVAKPVVGWLTKGPSAEQIQADAKEAEETRRLQEKAAADRAAVDAARAREAARAAAARPPAPPTPVRPVAAPQVWIVPSGTAGFFTSNEGVIDGSRAYLPGSHAMRPRGKIYLVNTEPEIVIFNDDNGDTATISATSLDNESTNVTVAITWIVVPENVALFKSKMGRQTQYTPIFFDIARGAVRTSIARFDWAPPTGPHSLMDREAFARDIQAELERHTEAHFRRLGFGDQSGNIIRFGQVSLRQITYTPRK